MADVPAAKRPCSSLARSGRTLSQEERRRFLTEAARSYAALRRDKKAWRPDRKELEIWDVAMMDGLEDE